MKVKLIVADPSPIVRYSMIRNPRYALYVVLTIVIVLGNLIWHSGHSQADAPKEYQVKAAFLYHFVTFVNWPSSTFKDTDSLLRICIMGKDPFGESLDTALRSKTIGTHGFEIQRNPRQSTLSQCHVLYLTASQSTQLMTYRQQYGNANVLTVGENDTFLEHGGMIQFFMDNQKVRFAINLDAIKKTNLKVSSKLLRLAKIVTP